MADDWQENLLEFAGACVIAGIFAVIVASALSGTDLGSTNSDLIGLGVFIVLVAIFYGAIKITVKITRGD